MVSLWLKKQEHLSPGIPVNIEKQIQKSLGVPSQKEALSLTPRIHEELMNPLREKKSTQYPNVLGSRPLMGPKSLVDPYQWSEEIIEEEIRPFEEIPKKRGRSPKKESSG